MGERIVYPNHIWSPWTRCAQLSPGENGTSQSQRSGSDTASVCRADDWDKPIRWNRKAELAGVPALVRIGPRGDWFDAAADLWRPEAWEVIRKCVCLRFLISTTRPLRIAEQLPTDWNENFRHVWLGVSVEDNNDVWRVRHTSKNSGPVSIRECRTVVGPLTGSRPCED